MPSFHPSGPTSGHRGSMPSPPPAPLQDDSLFRSVFDNTLEAVVIMDAHARVLEANTEACYLFGRTLEQMRSSSASELVDASAPSIAKSLVSAKAAGRFAGLLPLLHL